MSVALNIILDSQPPTDLLLTQLSWFSQLFFSWFLHEEGSFHIRAIVLRGSDHASVPCAGWWLYLGGDCT